MKKKISNLLFVFAFLIGCNNENNVSSSSNNSVSLSDQSSSIAESSSSSSVKKTNKQILDEMKNNLLELNHLVSSNTYSIYQEDYYGISVEIFENGTTNLYQDNFIVKEFEQKIGDDSIITGCTETGIENNKIYQYTYYGENDMNNSLNYYYDTDSNRKAIFDIGFVTEYVNNIIDVTQAYLSDPSNKIFLSTNFEEVEFTNNSKVYLEYRFISYAPNGRDKVEEVQRNDLLSIENNKIVKSETAMLYSLHDGVNYKYMEKVIEYQYNDLIPYEGEKLNK